MGLGYCSVLGCRNCTSLTPFGDTFDGPIERRLKVRQNLENRQILLVNSGKTSHSRLRRDLLRNINGGIEIENHLGNVSSVVSDLYTKPLSPTLKK